jgi:hypothetical protein
MDSGNFCVYSPLYCWIWGTSRWGEAMAKVSTRLGSEFCPLHCCSCWLNSVMNQGNYIKNRFIHSSSQESEFQSGNEYASIKIRGLGGGGNFRFASAGLRHLE